MTVEEKLTASVDYIKTKCTLKPRVGLVLGSGLGAFVNQMQVELKLSYDQIPCFVAPSVEGHSGQLVLGKVADVPIAVLQGRVHYYEGYSMEQVVHPARTLAMLGIETLILTNSAGGLDPQMQPGDFMIIEDHINMMGNNPLMGPNVKHLGPRFPDMSEAYDRKLNELMSGIFDQHKIRHWRGIYCAVSGPTYETPSEVRFLQLIGGKAVGMSTVPESIAANHLGLRVCAVSCITNLAAGLNLKKLSHDEVTETAHAVERQFCAFMNDLVVNL